MKAIIIHNLMNIIPIVTGIIKSSYQLSGREFENFIAEWFRHAKQRLQREQAQKQLCTIST